MCAEAPVRRELGFGISNCLQYSSIQIMSFSLLSYIPVIDLLYISKLIPISTIILFARKKS